MSKVPRFPPFLIKTIFYVCILIVVSPFLLHIGRNIEVTDALREKVEAKIGGVLAKLGENAMSTSVVLRVEKNDPKESDIVECTIAMKGGSTIKIKESQADMYGAIDVISDKVSEKLKQQKGKPKNKDSHRKEHGNDGEGDLALIDEMEKM